MRFIRLKVLDLTQIMRLMRLMRESISPNGQGLLRAETFSAGAFATWTVSPAASDS
jgi:hypothetical protein